MLTREKFDELLSSQSDNINAHIETIELHSEINDTKTTTCVHCLQLNGNGLPRVKDFAKYLSHRVINYAIPKSEIIAAQKKDADGGGFAHTLELREKAVNLFKTNSFCIYLSRVYYTSKCKDIVSLVRKRS